MFILSVLELAALAWTLDLTKTQTYQLEKVQKTEYAIIPGKKFQSCKSALKFLKMETLEI